MKELWACMSGRGSEMRDRELLEVAVDAWDKQRAMNDGALTRGVAERCLSDAIEAVLKKLGQRPPAVYGDLIRPVNSDEEVAASIAYWDKAGHFHDSSRISHVGLAAAINAVLARRAKRVEPCPPVTAPQSAALTNTAPLVIDEKIVDQCLKEVGLDMYQRSKVRGVLNWCANYVNGPVPAPDRFTNAVQEAFSVRGYTLDKRELEGLVDELKTIAGSERWESE